MKYSVMHWHYSKQVPFGKTLKFGVWENNIFIGAITYGYSSTPNVCKGMGLKQNEMIELTRVALNKHSNAVSKMISVTIRKIKKEFKGIELIVSFADADQEHIGAIYQSGNWIYTGLNMRGDKNGYIVNGKFLHCRSAGMKCGNSLTNVREKLDPGATINFTKGKYRYLYPLKDRNKYTHLAKPYPKRTKHSDDATINQTEEGGSIPTCTLQT